MANTYCKSISKLRSINMPYKVSRFVFGGMV